MITINLDTVQTFMLNETGTVLHILILSTVRLLTGGDYVTLDLSGLQHCTSCNNHLLSTQETIDKFTFMHLFISTKWKVIDAQPLC